MIDSIKIRPMIAADVEAVVKIAANLKEAPQWQFDTYARALDRAGLPRRIALTAEHQTSGRAVGFVVVSLVPPEAELETIAVAGEFQRFGIARRLFGEMIRMLRETGTSRVTLEVRVANRAALTFYSSLGFAEVGRRTRYYANPVEEAVLMALRFD